VPVFDFREEPYGHRIEVCEPLKTPAEALSDEEAEQFILQQFAAVLEKRIREKPEQWLWAHRRWKSTPNRSVLVLSDGKAGHLHQSMAVAEAIRQERAAQGCAPETLRTKTVEVKYKSDFWKALFSFIGMATGGHFPFRHFWLRAVLAPECYDEIMKSYADVVISAGSSAAGINLLVKHENSARALVVMRPPFGMDLFDAVIVPKHDRLKEASNIFVTERVLSKTSERSISDWAETFSKELRLAPGTRIGLLVGGDTRDVRFEPEAFDAMIRALKEYSKEKGHQILATTSRRTQERALGLAA
jgi:mitochondrial fission protein ELM1